MNSKYLKDPPRLKRLMEFWFLKSYANKDEVTGLEIFTLFDKLPAYTQRHIFSRLQLFESELPVFCLTVSEASYIINTTHRFIHLQNNSIETVLYLEFKGHIGFKDMFLAANRRNHYLKQNGFFHEFGVKLKTGEIIYWHIPTGQPGFAFWNVTKRCGIE